MYLPALDEVMQSLHRLFYWDCFVETVDLEEVDVVRPQPFQGRIDGVEDALTRKASLIDIINSLVDILQSEHVRLIALACRATALSADDKLMAWDLVLFDCFAYDTFGVTVAVDVRCIPGVQAAVVGCFEKWESLGWRSDQFMDDEGTFTSFSSTNQSIHLLSPMLIAPSMGTETLRPHFPSCRYST